MHRLAALLLVCLFALASTPAFADSGDRASVSAHTVRLGDSVTLSLQVVTPHGASVDVLPGAAGWEQIEVIRTQSNVAHDSGNSTIHALEVVIAPFEVGTLQFIPSVTVVQGADTVVRQLPAVTLLVPSSLAPGDKLELSPLAPTRSVDGAESPFLRPLIALGVITIIAVLAAGVAFAAIGVRRRRRRPATSAPVPLEPAGLGGVEHLLATDPVAAYRTLGTAVRTVVGDRYGFRAPALTTRELQRRMEAAGVERWQARLVGGLLEECDAVVYAGYRPAPDRRAADLTMAREIVEPFPEEVPA